MRFAPDWLIYLCATALVVFFLFQLDTRQPSPRALEGVTPQGALLPPPSSLNPEVLVEVGPITSGLGTAFAISEDGWWITARHVVDPDYCRRVGVIVSRGGEMPARVYPAQFADLALLRTDGAPAALPLFADEGRLRVGKAAFHVGFPQGRTGEAVSRLIGRETLIARGRFHFEQPVLAWAESGRTEGLTGTLAGLSGGPALDANGEVIGVTIAESVRRGRIYTATPATVLRLLRLEHVEAEGRPGPRMTSRNYGREADELRRSLAVAQVVCIADDSLSP